ncbi:RteC domain-containing protein [Niabella sp. W65]|nr:RteC domain-containing protein [Niabella sp. W65]MCH7364026.1 RteC domain-containing protein [Niabella sp. W65]ULT46479.1 RteC domain-containing protein [Niabella sp. I65]
MTVYLQDLLFSVKKYIIENEFKNDAEEIHFFRTIKPQILGKLIYYNKVYRIETTCPVSNGNKPCCIFPAIRPRFSRR